MHSHFAACDWLPIANMSIAGGMNRLIPLIIALALLMETIDSTILSTALPAIAKSIHAPILSLKLALATYLIALAALVPASGWVADRFGARRVFVAAMLVFLLGSVLCALQTTLGGLVAARALQGAGGAMMVPVGRLIVLKSVPKAEMIKALSYVTIPALVGPAVGPVLGALLTSSFGWPAIFLANVPLGMFAIVVAWRYLPDIREERVPPFDLTGFAISASGLSMLMFGIASAGGHVVSSAMSSAMAVVGALMMLGYFYRARMRSDALLDVSLLRTRTFSIGVISGALFRTSGGAAAFLLPLLFQVGLGLSIMVSGALSAVYAVGGLFMRAATAHVVDRFGFRKTLFAGVVATVALTSSFALVSAPNYALLIPLLAMAGLAQALVFTAVNGLVFADIPESRMSHATSFSAVSQQLALSCGIAVAAYALQLGGSPQASALPTLGHFALPFLVIAGVTLASLVGFARLRPEDGAALRHREHIVRHHWH